MDKRVCEFCHWKGTEREMLSASNPFDSDGTLYACPNCNEVNSVFVACDELGCWERATCGTPTKEKYRVTCGKHKPEY